MGGRGSDGGQGVMEGSGVGLLGARGRGKRE